MVDAAARLPAIEVCRDARTSINDGLKQLAQHLKKPGVMPTIVDALVADVTQARARAAEFYTQGIALENDRLLLVAAKYDEMIINADIRMLELGVKAANNEQMSIDRHAHIEAYKMIKTPALIPEAKASVAELSKLAQRQQLLAAAQATAKDAHFTEAKPFDEDQ